MDSNNYDFETPQNQDAYVASREEIFVQHQVTFEQVAEPEKKAKGKKKKGILPYILLPVSIITTVLFNFVGNLISNIILNLTYGLISDGIHDVIFYCLIPMLFIVIQVAILFLFSLCCKGTVKKLRFVTSAVVGINAVKVLQVVGMLCINAICELLQSIEAWDIDKSFLIGFYGIAIGLISLALECTVSLVVAIFFFKRMNRFEEKPLDAENRQSIFRKLLKPIIIVVVTGIVVIVMEITGTLLSSHYTSSFADSYYFMDWQTNMLNNAVAIATQLAIWGTLIGMSLILKDKYKSFSLMGSFFLASMVAGITNFMCSVVSFFIPVFTDSLIYTIPVLVINNFATLVIVIPIYLLMTKKEYITKVK